MQNKKVLLKAHFSVQNFKVSVHSVRVRSEEKSSKKTLVIALFFHFKSTVYVLPVRIRLQIISSSPKTLTKKSCTYTVQKRYLYFQKHKLHLVLANIQLLYVISIKYHITIFRFAIISFFLSMLLLLFAKSRGGHTDVVMALLEAGAQVSLFFCETRPAILG